MSESGEYRYLPARMAERLRGIEIGVRRPMDGSNQGLHRSPAFGSSVEFAEYREYMPGDPISQIDWPVYARSDRYVIRRFHEDVSIRCYVLLDISGSMGYKGSGAMSKIEYGSYLAAAMLYVMIQQSDTSSLITFDSQIRSHHEPTGTFTRLKPMLLDLDNLTLGKAGDIEAVLHNAAELIKGRALVMIISDFLQDPEKIIRGINHLYHDGKDVTLFHLMDPTELNMPISGLVEVVSMEQEGKLIVDFGRIKESYLKQLRLYLDQLRTGCQRIRADYIFADTGMDVYDAILQRRKIG
ncbi:MAG: DUF58 domain-containing protein [candidate division Zixibacteria bacterium]|nr:DUF58 domain-containing protein [candidate division Zixibacteria bacterium]